MEISFFGIIFGSSWRFFLDIQYNLTRKILTGEGKDAFLYRSSVSWMMLIYLKVTLRFLSSLIIKHEDRHQAYFEISFKKYRQKT